MSKDLRTFLDQVRKLGPKFYVEASKRLSPELEVQVLQHNLTKEGHNPVIYCPQIEGSKLPLVTNLCGDYDMMGLVFGMDPEEIAGDKEKTFFEYRRRSVERKPTKLVPPSSAPVKEIVLKGKEVDLGLLPITKQAPLNPGKYISAGQMISRDPSTGTLNCGIYRREVKGKDVLGTKMAPLSDLAYICRRHADLGKPMEVVTFIGHHPATCLGSVWSGSIDVNELEVMGGYLGEPLEMTQCETVDLLVPAFAEIAIEGIIDPSITSTDGPYSEWAEYYGEKGICWLTQITAITMRHDAIYHDLAPSQDEHRFLFSMGVRSKIYDAVKAVVPSVKSVYLPPSGSSIITCYVSIKKRIPGEGKRAGLAAVNAATATTIVVVVDEDIDVYNEQKVLWAVATRCCADTDIDIIPRLAGGRAVPTSYDETRLKRGVMASKMVIDATMPVELPFSTKVELPDDLIERIKPEDYIKDYKKF